MSLTNTYYTWYSRIHDVVKIIDNSGEFSNVPLLGSKGGFNYNSILARRQLGYAMKDKPNNIILQALFIQEDVDNKGYQENILCVWHKIQRKKMDELGNKICVFLEPYTQWVRARATKINMHYPLKEPMCPKVIGFTPVSVEDME